ncbi:DUF2849 domain-containing protein [Algimonas porphyrae]|nr:DUF2849 domain-containing protein [Algimonas porphyrae]
MTANELRSGLNVWMTADYEWSRDYTDALLTEDETVIAKMDAVAKAAERFNEVVGAYFIDTVEGKPTRYRERFRTHGPTYDTAELI